MLNYSHAEIRLKEGEDLVGGLRKLQNSRTLHVSMHEGKWIPY